MRIPLWQGKITVSSVPLVSKKHLNIIEWKKKHFFLFRSFYKTLRVIVSMQKELVKNCLFWLVYGYLQVLAEFAPTPQQSSIIQEPHPIRVFNVYYNPITNRVNPSTYSWGAHF